MNNIQKILNPQREARNSKIKQFSRNFIYVEKSTLSFTKQCFLAELEPRDIQETKRIGRKGVNPGLIIVTFTTLSTKIEIEKGC